MSEKMSTLLGAFSRPGGRRLGAGLAAISVLAFVVAVFVTLRIGQSDVSIGLDLSEQLASPPVATWGGAETTHFEAIPGAYAATLPRIELVPTAERNPASAGNEIWLAQHPRVEQESARAREKRFLPFVLGQRYLWYQINANSDNEPYVWQRNTDTPSLIFLKTPASGMVRYKTSEGELLLDLYSPQEEVLKIDEAGLRVARYYATVPRWALQGLSVQMPTGSDPVVHRLYVGTLLPHVYFSGDQAYPRDAVTPLWGHVETNWNARDSNGAIRLTLAPLEQGGFATFTLAYLVCWIMLAAIPLLIVLARVVWRRMVCAADQEAPVLGMIPAHRFFVFFGAFCVVYLFYLGCAYPGLMSPDSVSQWEQAHTWTLTDDHPALHTLSYKLIASVWDSTAAVALVQVIGMSLALAYACCLLLRAGVPNWIVVVLFHIALLSPKNGILSVTLWKDVPFSILILAISTLLFRLCFQRRERLDFLYWLSLGVMLGLLPLIRHNGLVILFGIAPLLPLLFWRWRFKALLLSTIVSLVLFGSVKYGVYRALDVQGWEGLNSYLYTVKTAILIDQDVPLSAAEYEFLNQIRPIAPDRWAFDSHTGNTTVNDTYNREFANANESAYTRIFDRLSLRYPLLLVQDHLERSHYVYAPAHPVGRVLHSNHYLSRPENRWAYQQGDYPTETFFPRVAPVLGDLITALQQGPCILFRPAVCLYLVLGSLLLLALRLSAPCYMVAFLPALLSTLSVLMIPIASQIRYQFPLTLTAGFLIGLAFMARPTSNPGTLRPLDASVPPAHGNDDERHLQ